MDLTTWQSFLGWSLLINWLVLILWVLMVKFMRDRIYQMHNYWIPISPEAFNAIHYGGIGLYKLLIFMFNLVPYLALLIIS